MNQELFKNKEWLERIYNQDKISTNRIAKKCGTSQTQIAYYMKKFGIKIRKPKSNKSKNKTSQTLKGHIVLSSTKEKLRLSQERRNYKNYDIKITPPLGRIFGHLLGDGGIGNGKQGRYVIRYCNSYLKLINSFIDDMFYVFGERPTQVRLKMNKKGYDVFYKTTIGRFLIKRYGDIFIAHKKIIPFFIFNVPEETKCAFLQAMFDDEGSFSIKARQITLDLKYEHLIKDLSYLINEVGIKNKYIKYPPGFRIYINHKTNLLLFAEKIGFLSQHKIEPLRMYLKITSKEK